MTNEGGSYNTNASIQEELDSSIEVVDSAQIGAGLSAATRKRMKKKEKERAKKVAAATSNVASLSNQEKGGRRVPTKIRLIQEDFARKKEEQRLREEEEAKKREEEERQREEEKERERKEEEEALMREEKRRKKEEVKKRTKEKLLKKKQEEAQRRLCVMPEKLLDKCTVFLSNDTAEHYQVDTREGSNCETGADTQEVHKASFILRSVASLAM